MSTNALFNVTGRLLGIKNVGQAGSITGAGWAKYDNNGNPVFKNRIIYSVYDKKSPDNSLTQVVEIVAFGSRFQWVAENIPTNVLVNVSGNVMFKPSVGKDGNAYANATVNVSNIDFMQNKNGTNGSDSSQHQPNSGAQQAPATQQAPAQQPQSDSQEELPF